MILRPRRRLRDIAALNEHIQNRVTHAYTNGDKLTPATLKVLADLHWLITTGKTRRDYKIPGDQPLPQSPERAARWRRAQ
jgi:hypothetical protein